MSHSNFKNLYFRFQSQGKKSKTAYKLRYSILFSFLVFPFRSLSFDKRAQFYEVPTFEEL